MVNPPKKYLVLGLLLALAALGKRFLGKPKSQNMHPVNIQLPDFHEVKKNDAKTLLDAYDEELSGKKESLLKRTSRKSISSLANLFNVPSLEKPKKEKKKAEKATFPKLPRKTTSKAAPTDWFVSYKADCAAQAESLPTFYAACLYEDQKVSDGGSISFKLQENGRVGETILHAGSLLYGSAKFSKNRIVVVIHVAQYLGKSFPVALTCYDSDFLPGIFCPGIHPIIENNSQNFLGSITDLADSTVANEVSKVVSQIIKDGIKSKSVKLNKGRTVYICAKTKSKK